MSVLLPQEASIDDLKPTVIQGHFHLLQVHGMLLAQDLCVAIATERADISAVVLGFAIIVMLCS